AHYEWNARRLSSATDPTPGPQGPEPCVEAISPYNYQASTDYANDPAHPHSPFDACIAHGFAWSSSVDSCRGDPGAATPALGNVETRTDVLTVDDFGRVLSVRQSNDVHRTDDDVCMDTTFATPTGSNEHVLGAVSSRTISDCGGTVIAKDTFVYDQLAMGSVSLGHLTSHHVE